MGLRKYLSDCDVDSVTEAPRNGGSRCLGCVDFSDINLYRKFVLVMNG